MLEYNQELAENKLLLLYIFDKIQLPVSNALITEIVLENNLLNYFYLQQYLSELVSSGFLKLDKEEKKQLYSISAKGKSVLEYFESRISDVKKDLMSAYFESRKELHKSDLIVSADYLPVNNDNYMVSCKIANNGFETLELKLTVKSSENAKQICLKWKNDASDIYSKLIKMLNC
jgi:predicted transcriptional regulator